MTSGLLSALLLCGALLLAGPLHACTVPVFRYALEHWAADPYQAVVLHRGPLTEAQKALVRDLGKDSLAGQLHANLTLRIVDLATEPAPEIAGLVQEASAVLPRLVLLTPKSAQAPATVWSGELTQETIRQVFNSPARQDIVERLGQGESAVWVLLEGDDRSENDAAAKLLEARLVYLDGVLALPKLDPQDIVNGLVSVGQEDLRLEFSVRRVARNDPAEHVFVQTLLSTEADLREATEPMVFPVFGQGRALYALVGAGLKHETIDQAASFLIGKCSCQVKELNPGADLLFAANWAALVKAQQTAAPDLPTLAELSKAEPVAVTFTPAAAAPAQTPKSGPVWLYVAGGVVVALLVARLVFRQRR